MRVRAALLAGLLAACGGDGGAHTDVGPRAYDAQAYELVGHFDWDQRKLVASESLTLLLGDVPGGVIDLDAAVNVKRVYTTAGDLMFTNEPEKGLLHVNVAPLGAAGTTVTFSVNYEAGTSDSLLAKVGRDADPVATRMVFTDSEPDRAHQWLVCHDHPSDRARWAVELTVAGDEDAVANGERMRDDRGASGRTVRYQIDQPIPTYLMAFAAGQIEHTDRTTGRVPLGVWYRRGLSLDPQATLDVVASAMAAFEKLVGPYPWSRYSVVLVPEYGGGMENATITFNLETSGQGAVSFNLNAHELAHHWFGDWVTMQDYDSVWFKEGMATLLAEEGDRARLDQEGKGRRFGYEFGFDPSDSVVDTSLHGLDKYTTGPYERAAWMITQIRAKVGEDAFWGSLRKLLADHALGTIDSEGFVRAFAPALDEASIAKVLAALPRKPTPKVDVSVVAAGGGSNVTLTLTDPASVMLVPPTVTTIDASGKASMATFTVGKPLSFTVPTGGYLALDEDDVHPDWISSFQIEPTAYYQELGPLFLPTTSPATAAFLSRSAARQEITLDDIGIPGGVTGMGGLYAELDSRFARRAAEIDGCFELAGALSSGSGVAGWTAALTPILQTPVSLSFSSAYAACGTAFGSALFGTELAALAGAVTAATAGRLLYLMSFDYGAKASFDSISVVATQAPSMQLREQAISRLSLQAANVSYTAVPPSEAGRWKAFFRDRLDETTSQTRLRLVWRGVVGLGDEVALPAAGQKLHTVPMTDQQQLQIVCQAIAIAASHAGAWATFQAAAQPWDQLGAPAAAALADPTKCPSPQIKRAAARPPVEPGDAVRRRGKEE